MTGRQPEDCHAVLFMCDSEYEGNCERLANHEGRHDDGMYTWLVDAEDAEPKPFSPTRTIEP